MSLLRHIALILVWMTAGAAARADYAKDNAVQIIEAREGSDVVLKAKLVTCTEATVTVSADLTNMTASARLPVTAGSDGRSEFELVRFTVTDTTKSSRYSFGYHVRIGLRSGTQPKPSEYTLPYRAGPFRVSKGPHSPPTHTEATENEEAVDWDMPIGTPVFPARAGTVVGFRQDCADNPIGRIAALDYNYVVVSHGDGTYAEYQHLKKDGVSVKLGDKVTTDKPIAMSGNSGNSLTPHLHLVVYTVETGAKRRTVPVRIRLASGQVVKPEGGKAY
jgi:murein DD-endopeptidase MepM/ murein hydrolase activator NlpD